MELSCPVVNIMMRGGVYLTVTGCINATFSRIGTKRDNDLELKQESHAALG